MTTGVCTNLPSKCSKAAQRAALPADHDNARCPECGAALLRSSLPGSSAGNTAASMRRNLWILVGVALQALAAAWLGWRSWQQRQAAAQGQLQQRRQVRLQHHRRCTGTGPAGSLPGRGGLRPCRTCGRRCT